MKFINETNCNERFFCMAEKNIFSQIARYRYLQENLNRK